MRHTCLLITVLFTYGTSLKAESKLRISPEQVEIHQDGLYVDLPELGGRYAVQGIHHDEEGFYLAESQKDWGIYWICDCGHLNTWTQTNCVGCDMPKKWPKDPSRDRWKQR